jgi:hypothetical protein
MQAMTGILEDQEQAVLSAPTVRGSSRSTSLFMKLVLIVAMLTRFRLFATRNGAFSRP